MTRHKRLFESYVTEMRASMAFAHAWWDEITADEVASAENRMVGIRRALRRWPCGPASHPRVLATYRKYFLACESLNIELRRAAMTEPSVGSHADAIDEDAWGIEGTDRHDPEEYPIPGWVLLIDMLQARHSELAAFLGAMVFRPIGYDRTSSSYV